MEADYDDETFEEYEDEDEKQRRYEREREESGGVWGE